VKITIIIFVVNENVEVHNHMIDGSIIPANPGVNPSLTITALAEYAISRVKTKGENHV
jgi:cholesterol oxidase